MPRLLKALAEVSPLLCWLGRRRWPEQLGGAGRGRADVSEPGSKAQKD